MENIFIFFTELLYKNLYFSLISAFIWGILSVILSPCHLGSIPLIVAFINGQGKVNYQKGFVISLIFSIGMLLSITIIGIVTGLMGRLLGDIGKIGFIFVLGIFLIIGFNFLGLIEFSNLFNIKQFKIKSKGVVTGFFLGILMGLTLGPCIFGFMAPLLALVFQNAANNILFSISLVVFFALGHILIFIIFGTFSGLAKNYLNFTQSSKLTIISKKVIGVLFILISFYIFQKYVC